MMQQQLYQQEQAVTQDASGQMVLCPVRLVYETQMLVQPGEQLQPNQTIFINPQNPPPWIQNRPVQNQVIYVQQMPTNYVQPQQHIDPNQLYIQNYGYQNLPQMLVQNPQEQIRPMQVLQQNIGPTQQIGQNIQTQRLMPNVNPIPNTINIVNTAQSPNIVNRPINQNQIANIELVNNVKPENTNQNMYRPVTQTIQQDPRQQIQPTVTLVPTNVQRPTNIYDPNVGQLQAIPPQSMPNLQFDTINKTNNFNIVPPPSDMGAQTFRPTQPRVRNNGPNYQLSVQPTIVQPGTPNIVNMNNISRKMVSGIKTVNIPSVSCQNNSKTDDNTSRKRKSESPDEIKKKISISKTENVIIKKIETIPANIVNCSDVGVNTSPIHKSDSRGSIQITQINSKNQNLKIKEELAKKLNYSVPDIHIFIRNEPKPCPSPTLLSEKDKLIRNTVFTQARGRVLSDKEPIVKLNRLEQSSNTESPIASGSTEVLPINKDTTLTEAIPINKDAIFTEGIQINKDTIPTVPTDLNCVSNCEAIVVPVEADKEPETKEDVVKKVLEKSTEELKSKKDKDFILTHVLDGYVIQESNIAFPIRRPLKEKIPNNSEESDKKNDSKEARSEKAGVKNNSKILNISHLHINDIEVKNDKVVKRNDNAITNNEKVKNKDKIVRNNDIVIANNEKVKNKDKVTKQNEKDDKKVKSSERELKCNDKVKNNEKVGTSIDKDVKIGAMDIDGDNPFSTLAPNDVKLWTAQELATHLFKYGWNDTISVLQEHEIDGESLLLVSKPQLLTIGVKEEHADIISNFVTS